MADISSLLINSVPTQGSSSEPGASGAVGTETKGQTSEFALMVAAKLAERQVAKSGKQLPQSDNKLEPVVKAQQPSKLHSHQLQGGLELIVAGEAPSPEGITDFAKTQGIDPAALDLLLGNSQATVNKALTAGALGQHDNKTALNDSQLVESPAATVSPKTQLSMVDGESYPSAGGDMLAAWIVSHDVTNNPAVLQSLQQPIDLLVQQKKMAIQGLKPTLASHDTQPAVASAVKGDIEKLVTAKARPEAVLADPAVAPNAKALSEALQKLNSDKAQTQTLTQGQLEARVSDPINKAEVPAVKAQELVFKAEAPAVKAEVLPAIAGRLLLKPNQVKIEYANSLSLDNSAPSASAVKLEVINLAIPTGTAAPASLGETAFLASQQSATDGLGKPLSDSLPEDAMQQALRKQDEQAEMSRRLTEALGQRLTAQIARGAWRVEMDLHPKSLGRIEIQLEMKNGELEANFHAANSATRELLAESMPRLRSALEEHGMETAYIELELANQGRSDGNSTTGQQPEEGAETSITTEPEGAEVRKPASNDGLDVLV